MFEQHIMSKRMQGLLLFLSSTLCFGQAGRTELFGAIHDPSGLPVPKAKVEAEDQATMARYSVVSDERGEYHILGLPVGRYVLTVEQPGFHIYRQSGITLRLADGTGIDVNLEVGQPSESVDVTAAAPLLQTASGAVNQNVDEQKISTLPLDGRNFIPLVTLSPGVALPNGQFLPRINGSRPRTNEYLYDGISVLQPEPGQVVYYPIIDGMEEFKLNINAYSPEYGRSNGGTIMDASQGGSRSSGGATASGGKVGTGGAHGNGGATATPMMVEGTAPRPRLAAKSKKAARRGSPRFKETAAGSLAMARPTRSSRYRRAEAL